MQTVSHQPSASSLSAVHMRACTGIKNAHNSVTVQNRTHVRMKFLLRITHTIISQSKADSSWITLYILPALQKYFHVSSKISAAMCDHPSSLFKNNNFCMHQNSTVSVVHYPVLHLYFYIRPSALCLWTEHLFTSNFLNASSSLPQEVPVKTCKLLWDSWHYVWSC